MAGGRPRGLGRVAGSGRKKGTPNRRTVAVAQALVAAGEAEGLRLTPAVLARVDAIGVMEHVMKAALRAGQINLALDAARSVAPYIFPRLQAIAMTGMVKRSSLDFSDEELLQVAKGETAGLSDGELEALAGNADLPDERTKLREALAQPRPVVEDDDA